MPRRNQSETNVTFALRVEIERARKQIRALLDLIGEDADQINKELADIGDRLDRISEMDASGINELVSDTERLKSEARSAAEASEQIESGFGGSRQSAMALGNVLSDLPHGPAAAANNVGELIEGMGDLRRETSSVSEMIGALAGPALLGGVVAASFELISNWDRLEQKVKNVMAAMSGVSEAQQKLRKGARKARKNTTQEALTQLAEENPTLFNRMALAAQVQAEQTRTRTEPVLNARGEVIRQREVEVPTRAAKTIRPLAQRLSKIQGRKIVGPKQAINRIRRLGFPGVAERLRQGAAGEDESGRGGPNAGRILARTDLISGRAERAARNLGGTAGPTETGPDAGPRQMIQQRQLAGLRGLKMQELRVRGEMNKKIESEQQRHRRQMVAGMRKGLQSFGQIGQAVSSLYRTWRVQRIRELRALGKSQREIRQQLEEEGRKRFKRMKQIRIATSVANTIGAAISGFHQTMNANALGPFALPLAITNMSATLAAGYAKVRKLRNLRIGGGRIGRAGGGGGFRGAQFQQLSGQIRNRRVRNTTEENARDMVRTASSDVKREVQKQTETLATAIREGMAIGDEEAFKAREAAKDYEEKAFS